MGEQLGEQLSGVTQGVSQGLTSLLQKAGLQEKPEPTLLGDLQQSVEGALPSLTAGQRLRGFVACFGIGLGLTVMGWLLFWTGSTNGFAMTYTLGNLCALCSTGFLMGPLKQCKNMFKARRIWATLLYLLSMAMTLVAALKWKDTVLTLIFMLLQVAALTWYCLSYIPFAQRLAKKFFGSAVGEVGEI